MFPGGAQTQPCGRNREALKCRTRISCSLPFAMCIFVLKNKFKRSARQNVFCSVFTSSVVFLPPIKKLVRRMSGTRLLCPSTGRLWPVCSDVTVLCKYRNIFCRCCRGPVPSAWRGRAQAPCLTAPARPPSRARGGQLSG